MLNPTEEKTGAEAGFDLRKAVKIIYTNYRGETARREIIPQRLWFGATKWHPDEQWLLDAIDVDKKSPRSFALRDIKSYLD
jgi:predicted DNA-binding transcriptional regulator YafY